jgi:hypothetical protein
MDFITVLLLITGTTIGVVTGALPGSGKLKKIFGASERVPVRVSDDKPEEL